MNQKKEQILAALKKLGVSSPTAIANETGIEPSLCGYHLRGLLKDGALNASGTSNDRLYAMPGQKLDGAPPQAGKTPKKKKNKGKRGKNKKTSTPRARTTAPESAFIPAVDAERRLILINGSAPQIFDGAQTLAIATLLFQHYEA